MTPISPSELKKAADSLPPSPQVFGKLGKLLRDPTTGLFDITELVNTDSSLTAQVLRRSNSAAFGTGLAIDNLDDAINRIGFREVFKMVGMVAVSEVFSSRNTTYRVDGARLWENALCCGLAMETFAQKLGLDDQEAYTLGLLRSFGKLVINTCITQRGDSICFPADGATTLVEWEEARFGTNNAQVAGFLLSTWNFNEDTVVAIQQQYRPNTSDEISRSAIMLNLSCAVAESLEKDLPGETQYWQSIDEHLQQLGLGFDHFEAAKNYAAESLDNALASVAA